MVTWLVPDPHQVRPPPGRAKQRSGAPVKADAARMQALLDASLVSWLGHLKAPAESRA